MGSTACKGLDGLPPQITMPKILNPTPPVKPPERPKGPFVCQACEDTLRDSKGGMCWPCLRAGRIK